MKMPVVSVQNMSVRFGDFDAVRDVSFDVGRGEIFGFLGANGAGKTTTIRVLCGLLPATDGRVIIDGIEFQPQYANDIKRRVGYMSQQFTLYEDLSVGENFDFVAALRSVEHGVYVARRDMLLNFIGFNQNLKTVVKDLPGGIKQAVALGVALIHDPAIVFLDEPTAGVAPHARMQFWKLIRELARGGKTIFVTTHYMDEAENCSRVALMRAGELIAIDTPDVLKQKTFGDTMYGLRARVARPMMPIPDVIDIWQPYGAGFHLRFRDGVNVVAQLQKLKRDWEIVPMQPSLEDVFIKLVEGDGR